MRALAQRLGDRRIVLTGHGTTAIWLILDYLSTKRGVGEVILPALVCPSVAQVVAYAGFRPRFADVRLEDFTIDPASVASLLGPDTRAVIPVHLFGHSALVRAIKALVGSDVFVIEDAAQSFGAHFSGLPHGALGDAAILSFGGTKVLNVGGGGALATGDEALASHVEERVRTLPAYASDELLALSHRNIYHGLMDLVRTDPTARVGAAMRSVVDRYRPLYRHRFPEAALDKLGRGLEGFDAGARLRAERAEATHAALAPLPGLTLTRAWADSGMCWRYSLLAESPRLCRAITTGLRRAGVHASNHYFSLARLFEDSILPNAEFVHNRIINLWVDEVATGPYIDRTAQVVGEVIQKEQS